MARQGNVSTLAFGGRPSTALMGLVGGTNGAEDFTHSAFQNYVEAAMQYAGQFKDSLPSGGLEAIESLFYLPLVNWNYYGVNFNFLDNLEPNSDTPLQFNETIAQCHAFYQKSDILDIGGFWSKVALKNYTCVDAATNPAQNPAGAAPKKNTGDRSNVSVWTFGVAIFITLFCL
jgi:hypothetical protein